MIIVWTKEKSKKIDTISIYGRESASGAHSHSQTRLRTTDTPGRQELPVLLLPCGPTDNAIHGQIGT